MDRCFKDAFAVDLYEFDLGVGEAGLDFLSGLLFPLASVKL